VCVCVWCVCARVCVCVCMCVCACVCVCVCVCLSLPLSPVLSLSLSLSARAYMFLRFCVRVCMFGFSYHRKYVSTYTCTNARTWSCIISHPFCFSIYKCASCIGACTCTLIIEHYEFLYVCKGSTVQFVFILCIQLHVRSITCIHTWYADRCICGALPVSWHQTIRCIWPHYLCGAPEAMNTGRPAVPPRTAGKRCGMGCSRGDAYPQAALETTPAIQHTAANSLAPSATPTRRGHTWLRDGFSPKGDTLNIDSSCCTSILGFPAGTGNTTRVKTSCPTLLRWVGRCRCMFCEIIRVHLRSMT